MGRVTDELAKPAKKVMGSEDDEVLAHLVEGHFYIQALLFDDPSRCLLGCGAVVHPHPQKGYL